MSIRNKIIVTTAAVMLGTILASGAAVAYTGIPAGYTFMKNLPVGTVDASVPYLKVVLIAEGCGTGITNTTYYGPKTKANVQCFQNKYKSQISAFAGYTISATGLIGTGTRAYLNVLTSGNNTSLTPGCPAGAVYNSITGALCLVGANQAITIISPNGGGIWPGGTIQNITWTSAGVTAITSVTIDLYQGGDFLQTIISQTANDGFYAWAIPTTLSSSDYKIRISNSEDTSIYDESNINFSIFAALIITFPNGGETLPIGSSQNITWKSAGTTIATNVKIDLYQGGYFLQTIAAQTANDGFYIWAVPTTLSDNSNYQIRISKYGDASIYDDSDSGFSIFAVLTVTSPDGGETWPEGTTQNITWASAGTTTIANVKIELYLGGSPIQIAVTPNDGSYAWTIPTTLSVGNNYKIRISDNGDISNYDESNANFSIAAVTQSIIVTSPNGGGTWTAGTGQNIIWTSAGVTAITSITIDLYQGGDFLQTIISQTANDGNYQWIVPDPVFPANNEYKIRISNYQDASVYDESNANFTIIAAPVI